jgi:hypothetical protein
MTIPRVPQSADELRRYADADIARRGGQTPPAPPAVSGVNQAIQIELHETEKLVEFKVRNQFDIDASSIFVPFAMLEITYYAMLGAKLAPVLAALSHGGNPGPSTSPTALSLHREPL